MPARRELKFSSFDEVMPEVDRLVADHTTVGAWSLGQICNHLAGGVNGSMHGYAVKAPWLIRTLVGAVVIRMVIKSGKIREGVKIPPEFVPKPGLDARPEAEALRESITRFVSYTGPFHEHPFAGRLSRKEWEKLHLLHMAHHLSFVLPG